jgi:hypothetical protein
VGAGTPIAYELQTGKSANTSKFGSSSIAATVLSAIKGITLGETTLDFRYERKK